MIKYLFRNDDTFFSGKKITNITNSKTCNDTSSIPSPKYKLSKEHQNDNMINQIEEDLLKSLNINCELMNTIYQIQFKILNTENSVQLLEIKKIIKIIERKKMILINTTKNCNKLTDLEEIQQNKINSYVSDFNKLLIVSLKLIEELRI